jgi:predicted Rossmann fold nucleotide-binding protein DprA/Smf involved in DNA uptake
LCGILPGKQVADASPLSPSEFYRLRRWLQKEKLLLSGLLDATAEEVLNDGIAEHQLNSERVQSLLNRGTAVALACDRWLQMGLWIVSPDDKNYPQRLRERLGEKSSPLLFGAGNISLLNDGGVAVVGSRNADEAAQIFAQRTGERAARSRVPIVSGGARGVDACAMRGALEAGGSVVGVLANNLAREAVSSESRMYLQDGKLALMTPVAPEAPFHAGNAMARNKYIYALADYAVVVSSDYGTGGTWNGAQEDLKYEWCPLFARDGEDVPEGNRRLLKQGATPISGADLELGEDLMVWFERNAPVKETNEQGSLFGGEDEKR